MKLCNFGSAKKLYTNPAFYTIDWSGKNLFRDKILPSKGSIPGPLGHIKKDELIYRLIVSLIRISAIGIGRIVPWYNVIRQKVTCAEKNSFVAKSWQIFFEASFEIIEAVSDSGKLRVPSRLVPFNKNQNTIKNSLFVVMNSDWRELSNYAPIMSDWVW